VAVGSGWDAMVRRYVSDHPEIWLVPTAGNMAVGCWGEYGFHNAKKMRISKQLENKKSMQM